MRLYKLALLALGLCVAGTFQAAAQQSSFELQLMAAQPDNNKCLVVFRAINRLGVDLDKISFDVYIISTTDSFEGDKTLVFPSVRSNRQKYAKFELNVECKKIGRLDMNGFTECKGDKDYLQLCIDKAQLSTKVPISFSNQPQG